MTESLRLTIAFEEPDEQGLVLARVRGVPGAHGSGRTRAEAREEAIEAMRFMLDDALESEHGKLVTNESLTLLIGAVKKRDLERHLRQADAGSSARARSTSAPAGPCRYRHISISGPSEVRFSGFR